MYKFLLCWRYLKTRYLAIACIVSVMLGVATLIVVNSVMNGFSTKLRTLLHSVLSDVVIEGQGMEGFVDPALKLAKIRKDPYLNEQIEAMAITLETFAMVQYQHPRGEIVTRPIRVVGIDPQSRTSVGGFSNYLERQKNQPVPSFDLPDNIRKAYEGAEARLRNDREIERMNEEKARQEIPIGVPDDLKHLFAKKDDTPPPMPVPVHVRVPQGAIIGHLIAHFKYRDPNTGESKEAQAIRPGDTIVITTVSGQRLTPVYDSFVAVDYFQSQMSEYDANCVFVPLEHLQHLRAMDNRASNILIKLKDYSEAANVVKALGKMFEHEPLGISTWEEKQGPLLKAIEIEKGILNVLLFMIIAVAGFGILAIFSMIVAEKTRDIGILKALGASSGGIMKIFVSYGLLLGIVGAGFGTLLGLSITFNINEVERFLAMLTGSRIFDGSVYYFNEIPTDVQPLAILIVNCGAVVIAVVFSILPALRAAMLHPVQALRYE